MPMDMAPESIQKMMLAPKMLLSIHVLQLNIMNLRMFVRAELEQNPLLEAEAQEISPSEDEIELDEKISLLIDEDIREQNLSTGTPANLYRISEEKRHYLESLITKKESLYEHLHWQLEVLARDKEEKRIGEFIIGNLDDDGFLNMDLEEMREKIAADGESFKRALRLVRSFDPIGIGARDLKESLLIQLLASGKGDTTLHRIVYLHLEDLEKGYFSKIAKALSVSLKEIELAKKRISYLTPKPAVAYGGQEAISVIEADVFLNKNNGTYNVEVNEEDLLKLSINRYYKSILKNKNVPKETIDYVKEKVSDARWVIDSLNQRKKTIGRVCEYLVEEQKDFLKNGDIAVKPLTLKQTAEQLSVSEATVSRVVSNKYAWIFDRMFPMKDFFAGKLKTNDGKIVSDRSVKRRIQECIEKEDKKNPLSDKRIASIFKTQGMMIARRTVTKYRESLKILSFNLRKE